MWKLLNTIFQTGCVTEKTAAPSPLTLRGRQHGIGLAHSGIGAKVDAQLAEMGALPICLQLSDQRVGVGALRGG